MILRGEKLSQRLRELGYLEWVQKYIDLGYYCDLSKYDIVKVGDWSRTGDLMVDVYGGAPKHVRREYGHSITSNIFIVLRPKCPAEHSWLPGDAYCIQCDGIPHAPPM